MLKSKSKTLIDNHGENQGVLANEIHGDVYNSTTNNLYVISPGREKQIKFPSLIPQIIKALADLTVISEEEIDKNYKVNKEDLTSYNISNKITHNNLIKYKDVIEEYSQFGRICEQAFIIVDNSMMGSKGKILRYIRHLYWEFKGQLLSENSHLELEEMYIIRQNADLIIDMIKNELEERMQVDSNTNILAEDLEEGLLRILCYSFVECKILEKPGDSVDY